MEYNVAYYEEFHRVYLKKDVFLYPYYLAKAQKISLRYYFGRNLEKGYQEEHRGAYIYGCGNKKRSIIRQFINLWEYVITPAKHIRTLFLIHTGYDNMLTIVLYKLRNPKGKVVLMADMDIESAESLCLNDFVFSKGIKGWCKRKLLDFFFNALDVISVEKENVAHLVSEMITRNHWRTRVACCHPCFDIENYYTLGLKRISYEKKEHAFLTVGRIGTYQKNTDMILDALTHVDMKDWKFYFVGPMINGFDMQSPSNYQAVFDSFLEKNPEKKGHVIVVGEIKDTKTLYEYYIQSSVFVLTSRYEGFANVTAEAAACGCYLLGTDVGGMEPMSNGWKFGSKVAQGDANGLAIIMQSIIDGRKEINPEYAINEDDVRWDKMIERSILPLLQS